MLVSLHLVLMPSGIAAVSLVTKTALVPVMELQNMREIWPLILFVFFVWWLDRASSRAVEISLKNLEAAEHQMHLTGGTSRQNSDPASGVLSDKAVGSPTRK